MLQGVKEQFSHVVSRGSSLCLPPHEGQTFVSRNVQSLLGNVVGRVSHRATAWVNEVRRWAVTVLYVPIAQGFSFLITVMCSSDSLGRQRSGRLPDLCDVRQIKKTNKPLPGFFSDFVWTVITQPQLSPSFESSHNPHSLKVVSLRNKMYMFPAHIIRWHVFNKEQFLTFSPSTVYHCALIFL